MAMTNEQRVRVEQVRESLAWNLHNIVFHLTLSDSERADMADKLVATARKEIGPEIVNAALDQLNDQLKAKLREMR